MSNVNLKALLAFQVQDEEKMSPAEVCEELIFQQGVKSFGPSWRRWLRTTIFACGRLKRMLTYLGKAIANIRRVANDRQRTTERVKSRITALEYERDPSKSSFDNSPIS